MTRRERFGRAMRPAGTFAVAAIWLSALAANVPAGPAVLGAATKPASGTAAKPVSGTAAKPVSGTTATPAGGATAKPRGGTARPATATPKPKAPAKRPLSPHSLFDQARNARELEDAGAYAPAAEILKSLRGRMAPDGDLEVALALDEARAGRVDSAVARLSSPLLAAGATDSLPVGRRGEYPYQREPYWLNGRYDGWHWYIVRARAELAARQGRWRDALVAARQAVEAWTLSGKDWHILAVCAARAGEMDEARRATEQAILLDPTLPEPRYLAGLWAWKDGRRNEAIADFRRALALDSSYRAPALALIRSRLPGAAPDTLPSELFTGFRQVALLTSPMGPKPEEFVQVDVPASSDSTPDYAITDSIPPGVKPYRLSLSVLVDDRGRVVLNQVPWYDPSRLDFRKVTRILASMPETRFIPARRFGRPSPVWISVDYDLTPN